MNQELLSSLAPSTLRLYPAKHYVLGEGDDGFEVGIKAGPTAFAKAL
jgi:hypothetical protein